MKTKSLSLLVLALLLAGCTRTPPPSATPPAAGATNITIKAAHPRIWLTPERLAWIKSQPNRLEWKRLITNCEDDLHREAAGLPLTYSSPINHALAYRVTGNREYARIAAKLCEVYIAKGTYGAMSTVGAVSPHGFGARIVQPEVAVSYDWLQDYLSSEDKARWAKQIMDWADWCWLETNPTKGMPPLKNPDTWSQYNPGDNFYLGYLMSLISAIAVYGEEPRAKTHIDLGMKKLAAVEDYLAKYARGGYSLEGTNYGTWIRHGWLKAALDTATDYRSPTWDTFLPEAVACRWQITAPDKKHVAPLGGQPVGADAPIVEDHTSIALVAMSHGDAPTQALAKSWYDSITFTRKRQNSWQPALWYRNEVKAANYRLQPLVYHATGSGYVSMRSSWETDATWVIMQCGPVRESHQDYAAGAVYVWAKNQWLTGPARLWGLGGEMLPSEYNNVLLAGLDAKGNPRGQPGQVGSQALPKDSMRIVAAPVTANGVTTVTGEAGRAYDYYQNSRVWPVLEAWTRKVVFRPPASLTLTDTVSKVRPEDVVIFQLQGKAEPWTFGQNYGFTGTGATLQGRVSLATGTPTLSVVKVYKGKGGALSSHTVRVSVPGGAKEVSLTNTLTIQ